VGALAELIKLGIKTASKQADEVVPKAVSKVDDISVFPKPQKMFPEDARPAGGEYLNPATQDILTGKNFSKGNISITPEGRPSFKVSPSEKEIVGSPDIKGATQIKTNLFKKKAGWKWDKAPKGYEDAPTLVSVENKGKHYYTLDAQFPEGVNLSRYAKSKTEPRLRPTIKGFVELGKPIGKISVRGKEHPVYDKIINREEGGQVLPVINKFYGGTVDEVGGSEERGGFDADNMSNIEDWTTPQARAALIASEAPSKGNANTDDYGPDGLFDLGYNRQELKDIRAARQAAYKQDALDRQNDGDGDIPYLSANTKYDTTRSQYAEGPLTTQQINQDVIYKLMDQSKARKNYEREKSNWLTTLVKAGKATPSQKAELENLKSYYKVNPEDFKAGDREREEQEEMLDAVDKAGAYLKGGFAPLQTGGRVLDGLDGAYMRKRNSKEKLEGMIGIQSRQYGGGLDDAYMNRRRSSAFADPNATSAFANPNDPSAFIPDRFPVSSNKAGGLPTIYREQGGPLPITSVYGQGIPRIVYRDVGGGIGDDYAAAAGEYEAAYGPADPGADDSAGDFGDEGGSYQKQMEAALSGQAPGTSKTADELLADTSLGYTPFELATIYRGKEGKDNQETAKRMAGQILSGNARTHLMNALYGRASGGGGWHGVEEFISNMTPQQLQNFNMAANGSSLFGDTGANDFSKGWRYGGPEGTLQDILERSLEDEADISDLTEQADYRKKYEEEFEKSQLSGFELTKAGLKGIASDISDLTSIQSKLTDDPFIMDQIAERMNARGLDFQPVNSFLAGAMDYGIPLLTGLPGTIAKGLSNLTGAGRTIGTVTKDGLSYNLSDTGKFSLNLDPQEVDYGNDPTPVKKRKPVQKAVASTTEEKPKEGIAGYYERLNKARPAQSRVASNKYIQDLLEDLYPDPRNRPTLG